MIFLFLFLRNAKENKTSWKEYGELKSKMHPETLALVISLKVNILVTESHQHRKDDEQKSSVFFFHQKKTE